MASTVINTRADLDAIVGTPQHAAFMAMLAGTLWHIKKDDALKTWIVEEDNATIERFGFIRADFANATPPVAPVYAEAAEINRLSAEAERAALLAAKAGAKADNIVQYLRDHTTAECAQYVQDNVTDPASAKAFLQKVAIVLSVLTKESLR